MLDQPRASPDKTRRAASLMPSEPLTEKGSLSYAFEFCCCWLEPLITAIDTYGLPSAPCLPQRSYTNLFYRTVSVSSHSLNSIPSTKASEINLTEKIPENKSAGGLQTESLSKSPLSLGGGRNLWKMLHRWQETHRWGTHRSISALHCLSTLHPQKHLFVIKPMH